MPSILEQCEKYFHSKNFYEILKINSEATEKEVKKAYHRLSLLVHPDRVDDTKKAEATEKFKVLGKIHSVLADKEKRKVYDETGQFDDDCEEAAMRDWAAYWRTLFKEITIEDINNYEKDYKGSETELKDLKRAYVDSKGSMDYILETVPFTNCDDEPRIHTIINELIAKKEVPAFKNFTDEPKAKKLRRRRKWDKEAEEANRLQEAAKLEEADGFTGDDSTDLALIINQKQQTRGRLMNNFLDEIAEKYANKAKKSTGRKRTSQNGDTPKSAKKKRR